MNDLFAPRAAALSDGGVDGLAIDPDRLWRSLMALARIGATPKGGVCQITRH